MSDLEKLVDKYCGSIGTERRNTIDAAYKHVQNNALAKILFAIHSHAEIEFINDPDQIVYREADVIALLVNLGHPAPVW